MTGRLGDFGTDSGDFNMYTLCDRDRRRTLYRPCSHLHTVRGDVTTATLPR